MLVQVSSLHLMDCVCFATVLAYERNGFGVGFSAINRYIVQKKFFIKYLVSEYYGDFSVSDFLIENLLF